MQVQNGAHIQYDTGLISRARLRLVDLGGHKVRKHCYISLLPPPYLLYHCSTDANILS